MLQQIDDFFGLVARGQVDIYNEFSLQHELGVYLRDRLANAKVQFERPVKFFSFPRDNFLKREIDISVFDSPEQLSAAFELKFPRSGQYPEQMFKACQDICFLEQLVSAGFPRGYFIMAADNPLFYRREVIDGIYAMFRGCAPITGQIFGPTGDRSRSVTLAHHYNVDWHEVTGMLHYFVIEVAPVRPSVE
jgi:hypothetical protein